MKTSEKILTTYALVTPIVILLGYVFTHNFDSNAVIRTKFTHPKTWEHFSEELDTASYHVIKAKNVNVVFSDTVPENTIGYRYLNEKLQSSHYIKEDTLHIWSTQVPNISNALAYYYIKPKKELNITGDNSAFIGDFNAVTHVTTSLNGSVLTMFNGRLATLELAKVSNSTLEVKADSIFGNPIETYINLNDDAKIKVGLDEKSKITLHRKTLKFTNAQFSQYDSLGWYIKTYLIGRQLDINLSDSIYQAQIPPR